MEMVGGVTKCAVPECINPVSGFCNLCSVHRTPGLAVEVEGSIFIITAWHAERGDEAGIILLNDWALGHVFSGEMGFRAKLTAQGFQKVRNLSTPLGIGDRQDGPPLGRNREAGAVHGYTYAYGKEIRILSCNDKPIWTSFLSIAERAC